MRRTRWLFWIAIPKTATRGRPLLNGIQLAPPSEDLKTPMSVPAYKVSVCNGSIANAFTGVSGIPLPEAAQVGVPLSRFVVFQMCCPLVRPKPLRQTYPLLASVGSIAVRPTYRADEQIAPVIFVSVVAPGVV